MRFGDRSDAELIRLAQAGWAPAFAVLVHRYAPVVRATRPRSEPAAPLVTSVFLHAMRELAGRDPAAPVLPWLLRIAGAGTKSPPTPAPLSSEELDAIWAELHRFWPDGLRHARARPWRRAAAVACLAVLAGLIPAMVLGVDGTGVDTEPLELRAVPLPDERTAEVADGRETEEADFAFPATPEEQEPEPTQPLDPGPSEPETVEPEPPAESEDPASGEEDDELDDGEDTTEDEDDDDAGESDGLLDGVLGEDGQSEDSGDDGDPEETEESGDREGTGEDSAEDEDTDEEAADTQQPADDTGTDGSEDS